ncbi:hypothetical protein IAT38_000073 [Cryptococcus sp. DSM 104549]
MEGLINNAKQFLDSDQGKEIKQQLFSGENNNNNNQNSGSQDAQGNKGQEGQFGQQGQYGAVTGQGFGGGLAKDSNGQSLQQGGQGGASYDAQGNKGQERQFGQEGQYGAVRGGGFGSGGQAKESPYEGMDHNDTTGSGGYGKNAQGGAFSRQNQMAADNQNNLNVGGDDHEGYKTGYSTPGYRKEDDDEEQNRARNVNVYGAQSDERGSKGYEEEN